MTSFRSDKRRWWRSMLQRFGKNTDGVAAIEMAILAAPFIAVIFVILESGIVYFSEFALERKVAEAGRLVRTGQVDTSNTGLAAFRTRVCQDISVLFDCDKLVIDVRSFSDFANMQETGLPSPIDSNRKLQNLNSWDTGGQLDVVVVRAFYEWNLLGPSALTRMSNLTAGKRLIAASASFRNEPFGTLQEPGG